MMRLQTKHTTVDARLCNKQHAQRQEQQYQQLYRVHYLQLMSQKKYTQYDDQDSNGEDYFANDTFFNYVHHQQDQYTQLIDKFSVITDHYKCKCNFCMVCELGAKIPTEIQIDPEFFQDSKIAITKTSIKNQKPTMFQKTQYMYQPEDYDIEFSFLLKNMIPKGEKFPFRLLISDTFLYCQGELKMMIYNEKDDHLKFVQEKMSVKRFQTLIVNRHCHKDPELQTNLKKIQFFYQQREQENTIAGKNYMIIQFQKNIQKFHETNQYKDTVIIKNVDGSCKELAQIEFIKMLKYRSVDPIWQRVNFIQMSIRNKELNVRQKFIHNIDSKTKLYNKVMEEVCYLVAQNNSEFQQVPTQQFTLEQQYSNNENYIKYITYKIVCYLELNSNIRVKRAIFEYKKNLQNQYNLTNCMNISTENVQSQHLFDKFMKNINLFQMKENLPTISEQDLTEKGKKTLKFFNSCYIDVKNKLNIVINTPTFNEPLSNEVFKVLNPNQNENLHDIIKSKQFNKMMDNFPKQKLVFNTLKKIKSSYNQPPIQHIKEQYFHKHRSSDKFYPDINQVRQKLKVKQLINLTVETSKEFQKKYYFKADFFKGIKRSQNDNNQIRVDFSKHLNHTSNK